MWKQYFKDIELKKIINQDVVRTSPGVEFFRTEKIQKIMVDILFCYSREHPDLSYRQVCKFLFVFFVLPHIFKSNIFVYILLIRPNLVLEALSFT